MPDIAAEPVLSLQGVSVRYDTSDDWIGDGIDLQIRRGETMQLLGPSGCGKSRPPARHGSEAVPAG